MTVVRTRCPLCQWESEPVAVEVGAVNGEWHARSKVTIPYRWHLDESHRPLPMYVTEEEE